MHSAGGRHDEPPPVHRCNDVTLPATTGEVVIIPAGTVPSRACHVSVQQRGRLPRHSPCMCGCGLSRCAPRACGEGIWSSCLQRLLHTLPLCPLSLEVSRFLNTGRTPAAGGEQRNTAQPWNCDEWLLSKPIDWLASQMHTRSLRSSRGLGSRSGETAEASRFPTTSKSGSELFTRLPLHHAHTVVVTSLQSVHRDSTLIIQAEERVEVQWNAALHALCGDTVTYNMQR